MFKNYEEYKAQRDALIAKAETAMNEEKPRITMLLLRKWRTWTGSLMNSRREKQL